MSVAPRICKEQLSILMGGRPFSDGVGEEPTLYSALPEIIPFNADWESSFLKMAKRRQSKVEMIISLRRKGTIRSFSLWQDLLSLFTEAVPTRRPYLLGSLPHSWSPWVFAIHRLLELCKSPRQPGSSQYKWKESSPRSCGYLLPISFSRIQIQSPFVWTLG